MTTAEYAQFILQVKAEATLRPVADEAAAYEVGQLLSSSFIYLLYGALWVRDFDMGAVTQHLESLYDEESYLGMVYFIFILANAADTPVPVLFSEMSANAAFVPVLASAIIYVCAGGCGQDE